MIERARSNAVNVVVLRSWPAPAGDWRAQFQVEATRVRGEIATPHPLAPGKRLKLRPCNHGWSWVAERP